jgi:hypothetical protein
MSRRSPLAVALFAFASFAGADPVHLLAPANGASLRGGASAELRWSAAKLPPNVEEWEAFLSIDGGRYYAFRITPHLDIDRQSFTFLVPNVDTDDARILIRAGDEEHETGFEIPGSFSIARDPGAALILPQPLQSEEGEAAREGDPAVLFWTDGQRNGSGLSQQCSTSAPLPIVDWQTTVVVETIAVAPAEDSVEPPLVASSRVTARNQHPLKLEPVPLDVDLLLVCRRRNI